jgi:LacI family transcriptional regulator
LSDNGEIKEKKDELILTRSGKESIKILGLVIPDNSNLFFAEIARLIEDYAFRHGFGVILVNTNYDPDKEIAYVDALINKRVDGVIFVSTGYATSAASRLLEAGISVVVTDREITDVSTDLVLLDNFKGGYLAGRYLVELGHRQISCITGPSTVTPSSLRLDGFLAALKESEIFIPPERILPGDFDFRSGEQMMERLLMLPNPPSACFVCNDMMAIGAIRSAHNQGILVPNRLSIIGFDNITISRAVFPALTTISQPYQDMARIATELLIKRIIQSDTKKNKSITSFQKVILHPKLIIRESCSKYFQ